ncbi:GlsB/YeaQ/YmgE family stress response membrane protein [Arthrobacter sp. MDB2-24]
MIEFAVVGLFVGALSRLIKPEKQRLGLLLALVLGLVGSLLGAFTAPLVGTGVLFDLNLGGLIIALIGAALLIATTETIAGTRAP